MKRLQWAIAMVLLALAQCAYADSIPTLFAQANIPFLVNLGGENQFPPATFFGPGVSITSSDGDVVCFVWCLSGEPFSAGSSLTPSIEIIDFAQTQGSVRFGGQVHPVFSLGLTSITALGSFTFPPNGKSTFTVSVPAMLNGPILGELADSNNFFNLQIPPGRLVLTFDFFPGQTGFPASYQFSQGAFTTVPEPGTLGLMVSGLAGILGAVLKKCNCKRPVL